MTEIEIPEPSFDEIYERKKQLFPVKATFQQEDGELRIRRDKDSVKISFYATESEWENMDEWYETRIKGVLVVEIEDDFSNPYFAVDPENIEVKT